MRVLIVNPPHPSVASRIPREPTLDLPSISGPLIDAGHEVELRDAEFEPLPDVVAAAERIAPDAILIGHSGSTSAHPIVAELTRLVRAALPQVWIVCGGVFPTDHWREILSAEPQIDFIIRGEGEQTLVRLVDALENGTRLLTVRGIAFRDKGAVVGTQRA
jgi:anaerobic magnesium-protoporphyrin IX monomethyl ester cyclase